MIKIPNDKMKQNQEVRFVRMNWLPGFGRLESGKILRVSQQVYTRGGEGGHHLGLCLRPGEMMVLLSFEGCRLKASRLHVSV